VTLPPGQIETRRFPVVGERTPSPELPGPEEWSLSVGGLVGAQLDMRLDDYMAMGHRELIFDIHCVTSWTRFESRWCGVPLSDVLDVAQPEPEARFVSFMAFSSRDHHTSLPLGYARENSWLVHEYEGAPLTTEHGGPVRLVTPGRYFYKSLKWVKSIECLSEDRLGWWEVNSSYHNNADPWAGDERFTTGSLRPEQLERFKTATNYDKYRGKVMLGLDLRGWKPSAPNLTRLYLKNCDLRGADVARASMRASNLSLSDLRGATLAGADLSGSDLEGADFGGADLTGANLSETALTATRFDGAVVTGAVFGGCWGLLESQRDYLVRRGIAL
jgi:DMSO/TMAO reductase YedYZ molybdopterin-dependent catalytic subunit